MVEVLFQALAVVPAAAVVVVTALVEMVAQVLVILAEAEEAVVI